MGATKTTIKEGDGENYPKKGDKLTMHYTGTLKSNGTKVRSEIVGE
jgi:FK506-binding protein 1